MHALGRVALTGIVLSVAARALHPDGFWPDDEPARESGETAAESSATESPSTSPPGPSTSAAAATSGSSTSSAGESGWPTPETTGVRDAAVLTPWTGSCTLDAPGQVIENRIFECGIEITAPGVTIRNSLVRPRGDSGVYVTVEDGEPAVIEDVTVRPEGGCKPSAVAFHRTNYHARRVEVVGFGEAFVFTGDNTVVEDSYAKTCAEGTTDFGGIAVGGYGAHDATAERPNRFAHNTIDQRCGRWPDDSEEMPPPRQPGSGNGDDQACDLTAPLLFWVDSGDGFEVLGNLLRGGAVTMDVASGDGHTVVGNVVERDAYAYDAVYDCIGVTTWSDNWEADVGQGGVVTDRSRLDCARAAADGDGA